MKFRIAFIYISIVLWALTSLNSYALITDIVTSPATVTIPENNSSGAYIATFILQGSIIDIEEPASISLVGGAGSTDNASFYFDPAGGFVLRTSAIFNYEIKNSYSIRVEGSDDDGYFAKVFTISVSNLNEPITELNLSNNTINENAGVNAIIGTFTPVDQDNPDSYTYQLLTGEADFNISGNQLRADHSFDYEIQPSYNIQVRVTDGGGNLFVKNFTINVNPLNEPPTDITMSSQIIDENLPVGTLVGTFTTIDSDVGDAFSYTLLSGEAYFSIPSGTNQLVTDVMFNAELLSSYLIQVRSVDNGGNPISKNFLITINNIDEAPTDIGLVPQQVAENAFINTQVGILSTIDPDGDLSFVYSLVPGIGGEDNDSFNILSNRLRTSAVFDFETKNSYSVLIRSTSGLQHVDKAFTIAITDVNDPPVISVPTVEGVLEINEIVTAKYIFTDTDGDTEGLSRYQWRVATSGLGAGEADIPLATANTFVLETEYGGRWISVDVTPYDQHGLPGIKKSSVWYYINAAPVFTALTVDNLIHPGAFAVGETVVINTTSYLDAEADPAGIHTYKWYHSNTGIGLGSEIPEETDPSYLIKPQDKNKYISAGAIPVATAGSTPGVEARTLWYQISEVPTATMSGIDSICVGETGIVQVALTGDNPPWSITYAINGVAQPPIPNIVASPYQINSPVIGTYTLIKVSDAKYAFGDTSGSATISAYKAVSALLTLPEYSVCSGDTATHEIPVLLTGNSPWSITYTRNSIDTKTISGIIDPISSIKVKSNELGVYAISQVSDVKNCLAIGTGTTEVIVRENPIVSIAGDSLKCSYESTTLPVSLTGNGPWTFSYTVNNGSEIPVFVNQDLAAYIHPLPVTTPGTYQVTKVSDEDGEGCSLPGIATVADYPAPVAGFSDGPEVCEGAPTKLSLDLIGTAPWLVNYRRGGESPVTDTIKAFKEHELVVSAVGTYTLLDVNDQHCDGSASGSISIIEAPDVSVDIGKTIFAKSAPVEPLTVDPVGGHFNNSDNPGAFFNNGVWNFIPIVAFNPGVPFDIVYTSTDAGTGCIGRDSVKVFILESVAEIQVDNDSVGTRYCFNQDTIIIYGKNTDDVIGSFSITGNQEGLVDFGDNTAGLLPSILQSGSYTVTYSVTIDGTLYQPKKDFTFEKIDGDFSWDNECFVGQSLVNFVNSSTASQGIELIDFEWQIGVGDTVYKADTSQFSFSFDVLDTYPVQFIVSSESCRDTVARDLVLKPTIPIYEDPYIQNFTDGASFWSKGTSLSDGPVSWTFGRPEGTVFEDNPDQRSWYTSIVDDRAQENSFVISPCFDFSDSKRPMIQMKTWQQFAGGETDGANLQYTRDNGVNWITVGTLGDGIYWYNSNDIAGSPGINWKVGWSQDNGSGWQTSIHALNSLIGEEMPVRFRINYGTPTFSFANPRDGFAIDDILIGERTKRVLIEHFTNMSDTVSKRANQELNTIVEESGLDVLDIQYHVSYPGVDSFFTLDPVSPVSREYYYNVPDIPYAIVDGGGNGSQDYFINYKTGTIDPLSLKKAVLRANLFDIHLAVSEANGALAVDIDITSLADLGVLNLTVHAVVIESVITDVTSIFDEVEFRNVARAMLPDAIGTNIYNVEWNEGTSEHIALDYNYDNIFDKNEVRVVVFVQDESTKIVYQTEIADPNNPNSILPTWSDSPLPLRLYPNPASDRTIVDFNEQIGSNSEIQIVDYTGRLVLREKLFYGQQNKVLDLNGLESGIYIVRLTENGNLSGMSKLVILSRR